MKPQFFAVLMLAVIMSFCWVAVVQPQQIENSKGGFNVKAPELAYGKPQKPPTGGIATGIVAPFSGKRYAIIIGISDYYGTVNDLEYCDDDANDFVNALPKSYQITLLLNSDAKRQAILDAIKSVGKKAKTDDEVVFFYSGHGSVSSSNPDGDLESKDECIIPYECQFSYFIWDGELAAAFSGFTCRIMFYFDSCYSGGMTDLSEERNRLICMACGERQLSLESSVWENGQFTYYFVDQGMSNPSGPADKNTDGQVTFEEAFDFAAANCQTQKPTASDGFEYDMLP